MKKIRSYSELSRYKTFEERYEYLKLKGRVGDETFGHNRYLNQQLYQRDPRYISARRKVILRDNGCDLGIDGLFVVRPRRGFVHHMNPITIEDIENDNPDIFDPEYMVFTSDETHNAIHYGDDSFLVKMPEERKPNDTVPWRK